MGRGRGVHGFLGSPIYAARIRLDALANELLEPLSDLLETKRYLFPGDTPSSLDCAAFGYLALMYYAPVPQAWLKEAMQTRFPRLVAYIERIRSEVVGSAAIEAKDVWAIASQQRGCREIQARLLQSGSNLPWGPIPPRPLSSTIAMAAREIMPNLPVLSTILQRGVTLQAADYTASEKVPSSLPSPLAVRSMYAVSTAILAAVAAMAIQHRRSPREGDLIFWALRPSAQGLGEAGNILSVLAGQPALSLAM